MTKTSPGSQFKVFAPATVEPVPHLGIPGAREALRSLHGFLSLHAAARMRWIVFVAHLLAGKNGVQSSFRPT